MSTPYKVMTDPVLIEVGISSYHSEERQLSLSRHTPLKLMANFGLAPNRRKHLSPLRPETTTSMTTLLFKESVLHSVPFNEPLLFAFIVIEPLDFIYFPLLFNLGDKHDVQQHLVKRFRIHNGKAGQV